MAHAHINSDPETRSLLNEQSEQAGMPRTQFLRVLTRRYGPVLVRDLTQPASVAAAPEQSARLGDSIAVTCLECEWVAWGFVDAAQRAAREHHEKTGHLVGPYGSDGPASREWVDGQTEEVG